MNIRIRQLRNMFFLVTAVLFLGFLSAETDFPDDLQLVFLHAVWRHGDRSQDGHLNNFPVNTSDWIKGGGGYGQLSPEGMAQHFHLGKKLRDRYIKKFQFLHPFYDSQQVYVRSTDSNRTINSAVCNMLGMYMSDKSRPGIDYPDVQGWPRGFMPLPIHNGIPYPEDCVVNTFCRCKRRDALMKIAHQGEQFQNYIKSKNYVDMITKISDAFNTTFDATTLWKVHDAVHTELIHFRDVVKKQPWFNDQFHEDLEEVNRQATVFTSGLFNPPVVQGINVRREILKARGGPLVNEIAARMRTKARCAKNPAKCDKYHKNLKYHVYSAHDHTVYALLSVLGIEDVVNGKDHYGQWPNYAANILIEMFHNQTDGQAYFRVLYADNEKTVPSVVTPNIKECNSKEFCDLQVLDHIAKEFRPDRPMKEFCEMLPKSEDIVHTDDDNSAAISDIKNYLYLTVFSYLIHKHI